MTPGSALPFSSEKTWFNSVVIPFVMSDRIIHQLAVVFVASIGMQGQITVVDAVKFCLVADFQAFRAASLPDRVAAIRFADRTVSKHGRRPSCKKYRRCTHTAAHNANAKSDVV